MKLSDWQYKNKITLMICIFTFIPLFLLSIVFFNQTYGTWRSEELGEYNISLAGYGQKLNQILNECEQKAAFLNSTQNIRNYLIKSQSHNLTEKLEFIQYFENLTDTLSVGQTPLSIHLIGFRHSQNLGSHYLSRENFADDLKKEDSSVWERIESLKNNEMIWLVRKQKSNSYGAGSLCLYRKINEFDNTVGMIEIAIPVQYLSGLYKEGMPENSVMLWSLQSGSESTVIHGAEVWDEKEQETFRSRNRSKHNILKEEIPTLNGQAEIWIPKAYVFGQIRQKLFLYAGVIFLIFVSIIFIIRVVANSVTRQLTFLIDNINRNLKNLMVNHEFENYNDKDFRQVGQKIYELIELVKEYYKKIQNYETKQLQLELELLQARFDPHFLYNTLGTIKYLVPDPVIKQSIDSMISYYRIVLSKGSIIIRIAQEIELIEKYIYLQQFTYNMKITVNYDISPVVKGYTIIKHILQPVVENALMHGLGSIDEGGILWIRAYKNGESLFFEIIDNGIGMDPEKQKRLLSEPTDMKEGYGLYNVQRRIQVYYGLEYGVHIDSRPQHGTKVTLQIPAVRENAG